MESSLCKNPKVYLLQVEHPSLDQPVLDDNEPILSVEEIQGVEEKGLEVSINAISGCSNNNAMRLHGRIGACAVEILVDSRSTYNFLDPLVAQAARSKIEKD